MDVSALSSNPYLFALFGLVIITLVMLRLAMQRFRKNREIQQKREAALEAARKTERKRQQDALHQKSKVYSPKTRAPLADPFGLPFTGNIQGMAAKWEAEIHQIGRQIIGQIDSKMAALQAITLEANRTANRLDILVEHLETLAQRQIEWHQNLVKQVDRTSAEEVSATVMPATEPTTKSAPLADVLKELADDLQGVHDTIKRSTSFEEQPMQAMVLRTSEIQERNLRSEVEMLANYGVDSKEIASRLNIPFGEVDLILQMQQSR